MDRLELRSFVRELEEMIARDIPAVESPAVAILGEGMFLKTGGPDNEGVGFNKLDPDKMTTIVTLINNARTLVSALGRRLDAEVGTVPINEMPEPARSYRTHSQLHPITELERRMDLLEARQTTIYGLVKKVQLQVNPTPEDRDAVLAKDI